jgi:endonuclease III
VGCGIVGRESGAAVPCPSLSGGHACEYRSLVRVVGERRTRSPRPSKARLKTRLHAIEARLRRQYGQPRHHNPADPLDDLIFIVLSRMTQEVKYVRTYQALRSELPSWGLVRDAAIEDVERVLHDAGLARTKARHLKAILGEIERREGTLSLESLAAAPDAEIERYLASLPGVSAKTAKCVMLYALGRDTLPVDAHVWRLAVRLGLAAAAPWSEKAGRTLEALVPVGLRASLHVTMVAHGRAVCTARAPGCEICVLRDLCPHGRSRMAR